MKIELKNVNYIYNQGNPFEVYALKDINLSINQGDFIGLIGHTGSGKSTLVQHLNGLYRPTTGDVIVAGVNTREKGEKLRQVRQKVGLVFQYPEHQLFEETIYKDIAYGPTNNKVPEDEVEARVIDAMALVGLNYETMKDKSPFELSGGQKRRVAIAGVLAMHPRVLVLDEPTAGLDPGGRDELLSYLKELHSHKNISIILVSHSMEDIARLANRIIVMGEGKVVMDGSPSEVFSCDEELRRMGLGIPQVSEVMRALKLKYPDFEGDALTVEEGYRQIKDYLGGKSGV